MATYHDKLKDIKKFLAEEPKILINTRIIEKYPDKPKNGYIHESIRLEVDDNHTIFTPILHNKDQVILQFYGWSINLYDDGTWIWTATDGG